MPKKKESKPNSQDNTESLESDVSMQDFLSFLLLEEVEDDLRNARNKSEALEKAYKNLNAIIEEARIQNQKLVLSSYNGKYHQNIEMDETGKKYTGKELFFIDWGKMLALHHNNLDRLKKELTSSNSKENKYQFLIRQQLLLLDYFGVLEKIKNGNTDDSTSLFLAGLLNRNPQEIRTYLGKLANIKSPSTNEDKKKHKSELIVLKKAVDSFKIKSISSKLKSDIQKLND